MITDAREAVDIRFPRPEISALDGVIKKPVDTVAVIGIVFRCVDSALCRYAVSPSRTVLTTKGLYIVPELTQRGSGRRPRQSRPHNDDREVPFICRADEP